LLPLMVASAAWCRRALENQPRRGSSKPASIFSV
jgi:hypothetical protein